MDWVYLISVIIFAISSAAVFCIEFNRDLFGVEFYPYIKAAEDGIPAPASDTYAFEDVKTMMEIVSTKFSRVFIESVDAYDVPYVKNDTYYLRSNCRARTAEAAALINREKDQMLLTVIIGAYKTNGWEDDIAWETEVQVAIEAAEIANFIYPGTVEGIFLSSFNFGTTYLQWANFTHKWIKDLRRMTADLKLKYGVQMNCENLSPVPVDSYNDSVQLRMLKTEIIHESDFVICYWSPVMPYIEYGGKRCFLEYQSLLLEEFDDIKRIKPEINAMMTTYWPGTTNDSWHTTKNFKEYWEAANEFASKFGYKVYLNWAFDVPDSDSVSLEMGWWSLKSNSLINNASGYIERISAEEMLSGNPNKSSKETYSYTGYDFLFLAGLLGGACVLFLLVSGLVIVIGKRMRSNAKILTKQDIQEFKLGSQHPHGEYQTTDPLTNILAFGTPYDDSMEIKKSELTILWDEILGGGQFGIVYRAIIGPNKRVVALKMARQNCKSVALKGILSEIKILTYLGPHPNIVSICGAYTAKIKKGVVYLAMELCPLGSLKKYLKSVRDQETTKESVGNRESSLCTNPLDFGDDYSMIRWSYEIACGMEHLERKNVIHADLATRNVLLTSDGTAKITDFGLSRRLYEYSNYTKKSKEPLPWRWMAFESLKRKEFTLRSDVWSYGVTIWEIFSLGDLPFPNHDWNQDFMEAVETGLRLRKPKKATDELYQVMKICWQLLPEHRPSFVELREETRILFQETYQNK